MNPQVVDQLLRSADVAAGSCEALGERSHQDVDVARFQPEVINQPTAPRPDGSDLVSKLNFRNEAFCIFRLGT